MKAILGVIRDDGVRFTIEVDMSTEKADKVPTIDFAHALCRYGAGNIVIQSAMLREDLRRALSNASTVIRLAVPPGGLDEEKYDVQ